MLNQSLTSVFQSLYDVFKIVGSILYVMIKKALGSLLSCCSHFSGDRDQRLQEKQVKLEKKKKSYVYSWQDTFWSIR